MTRIDLARGVGRRTAAALGATGFDELALASFGPLQRPHKKIIETIEYNLEQLEDLDPDELDLLRETIDTLIEHVERIKLGNPPS